MERPHLKTRPKRSALQQLGTIAWRTPLWSIPTALFFGTLFGDRGWTSYWFAYQLSMVFGFIINVCIWALESFVLPRQRCEETGRGWQIPIYYAVAALIGSYIAAIIIHFTLMPGLMGSARSMVIVGMFSLLFTGLIGGIISAISYHRQAVDRAGAIERLRAELAEAELRALRAQVHPHFLFNALNTIAALVREQPAAAEDTITRLAEVFRYTLRASDREFARLGEELEFLRSYLEIERVRFGARLQVQERIESGLEALHVPSLLLQPVVENAVRHGVSAQNQGGTISISARRDSDRLILEVRDDGPGFDPGATPSGNGFGLHSVRERLRGAGPPHDLVIEATPGGGTTVRITLPVRSHEPGADPQFPKEKRS